MLEIETLYETDYNLWIESQVQALREGRFGDLDLENLMEEIESLGRSDRRALESYLEVIFTHLLKWQFQSEQQCNSWSASILNSRLKIVKILKGSPSLRNYLPTVIEAAYSDGRELAAVETGLPLETFPIVCPYTLEEALDKNFLPERVK